MNRKSEAKRGREIAWFGSQLIDWTEQLEQIYGIKSGQIQLFFLNMKNIVFVLSLRRLHREL